MVNITKSSQRNGGSAENFSTFEKNTVVSSKSNSQNLDINQHLNFPPNRVSSADGYNITEDFRTMKGTSSVSQSSVVSRKNDQWNVKRDIPVGTVSNNPFSPEPKRQPSQLKYQKKQWDTSNIPKGSVAARIQESNSPRKSGRKKKLVSPTKAMGGSNSGQTKFFDDVSGSTTNPNSQKPIPRVFCQYVGTSLLQSQQKSVPTSSSKNLVQQQSSRRSHQEEGGFTPNIALKPSREIPSGTAKSRLSSFHGRRNVSKGSMSEDIAESVSTNIDISSEVAAENYTASTEKRIVNDDDEEWIIPVRNAAHTQVFASDWGEAIPTKSAESDDWDTPAKEWIRSGESQTEVSSSNEVKQKISEKHKDSPPAEITSSVPVEIISQNVFDQFRKPRNSSPRNTRTLSKLSPPPKDADAYHKRKGQSCVNETSKENESFAAKIHSSLSHQQDFNNNFETFTPEQDSTKLDQSAIDTCFPINNENAEQLLIESSDMFGFPVAKQTHETYERKSVGEIIGGDEFFDASVLPNDYERLTADESVKIDQYPSISSTINVDDGTLDGVNEFHSGKGNSHKKKKRFLKGLFGRKSKGNGKVKQLLSTKEKNKVLNSRKEHSQRKNSFSDSVPNLSEVSFQNSATKDLAQHSNMSLVDQNEMKRGKLSLTSNSVGYVKTNQTIRFQGDLANKIILNKSIGESGGDTYEHNLLDGKGQGNTTNTAKTGTNEFDDVFSDQNNAFKECMGPKASNIGGVYHYESEATKSLIRPNVIRDEIFDDLEPHILLSKNVKKLIEPVFLVLDPRLDHLDSNIESDDELNQCTIGATDSDTLSFPQGSAPLSRQHSHAGDEELRMGKRAIRVTSSPTDGKQSSNASTETGQENDKFDAGDDARDEEYLRNDKLKIKAFSSNIGSDSKILSKNKLERMYDSRTKIEEETKCPNTEYEVSSTNRENMREVSNSRFEMSDSKWSQSKGKMILEPNNNVKEGHQDLSKINPSASVTRLSSPAKNLENLHDRSRMSCETTYSHPKEINQMHPRSLARMNLSKQMKNDSIDLIDKNPSKLDVPYKSKSFKKATAQSSLRLSTEVDGGRFSNNFKTHKTKARETRTVITSFSKKTANAPNISNIDHTPGSNVLPTRYTKNSVFNRVLNLNETIQQHGWQQQEETYTCQKKRYRKVEKPNIEINSRKFLRAMHAYNSMTKKSTTEEPEDQRKYMHIPAASSSASDVSYSSTYDSYQRKLAVSLAKANIISRNSSEFSLHSNKSLDDSSIKSDIRVLRSILRRPRLNQDNHRVILASRQIQGFPTYDTVSATDPMQRVGMRLLASAIIPIQTEVRRFLAMRHALTRMWALIVIQTYTRRFLVVKHFKKALTSTVTIQAVLRGHLARNDVIDKHICAIEIQRFVRGYLATMQVYEDIYKVTLVQSLVRMRIAMDNAAYRMSLIIQVQSIARGFLARQGRAHLDNCATLIQSGWRCFFNRLNFQFDLLDIIIVQSLWRKKLCIRVAAMKVEDRRNLSATRIQAEWRAYDCRMDFLCYMSARTIQTAARMFLCRLHYVDYQAAMVIQSLARMYFCRIDYAEYKCAKKIQSVARMYLCRYDYREYKAAITLQSTARMFLCRSGYVEYRCSSKIQSVGRMYLCRYDYIEYKAATIVQSVVRMFICRSGYVEYQCATKIQSIGRMFLCRYDYLEYKAATILQSVVRMFLCRTDCIEYHSATTIQAAWRSHDCRMDFIFYTSSRKLQSIGRMYLCRIKYTDYQEATASRRIQTKWRAYACRKIYIESLAVTMIQAKWRSYDCSSMYKRYKSARVIQKTWRSYDCQMNFLHFLADILIIQSSIRRYLVQKKVKEIKIQAAMAIQRMWRGFVCFADYEEFKAARKIQSAWRGLISYIDYQEHLTVRRIQSTWRAFVCRRDYKLEKAAILIQSTWRGFLFYADYMFELSDIVLVQKQIRGWLAKRVACRRRNIILNTAAIIVQKNWRRAINEIRFSVVKRDQHASTVIQTYWRRFWCFSNYIIALDCSIQIQSQGRRYIKRKEYLSKKLAVTTIESIWQSVLTKKLMSQLSVIEEITNSSSEVARKQFSAAIKVQRLFRGSLCRNALKVYLAAVLIQSLVRGNQARVAVRLHIGVRRIQALWRSFPPRRSFITYIAARKIQANWRGCIPRQGYITFVAARCIQNSWRCTTAKHHNTSLRREFDAASSIQSVWRCFVSYTDFVFTLSDIVAAQKIARGYLSRKKYSDTIKMNVNKTKNRSKGAVTIQKIYRGFQARQNYWYILGCTMQIQSWWRGRRIYRRIKKEANAILTLQCFTRCSFARQEYMQRRFVFMLIQTADFERSKKLNVLKMKEEKQDDLGQNQLDAAASVIQRFFLQVHHHRHDQLMIATKRRKSWRGNMKKEKCAGDAEEEALLEDIWIDLVMKSTLDEEPFTRNYTNLDLVSFSEQNPEQKLKIMNDEPGDNQSAAGKLQNDSNNFVRISKSATCFATPHPTSSMRIIRKANVIKLEDDFQLEEAFIDAEICCAKERRFTGSNYGKNALNSSRGKLATTKSRRKERKIDLVRGKQESI